LTAANIFKGDIECDRCRVTHKELAHESCVPSMKSPCLIAAPI